MKRLLLIVVFIFGLVGCTQQDQAKDVHIYNVTISNNDNTNTYNEESEELVICNSKSKVYHNFNCRFADSISIENKKYMNLNETISKGYRECKICK